MSEEQRAQQEAQQADYKRKRFIVEMVACHQTPQQVASAVKEHFGLDMSRQSVEAYDPLKATGRNLSQEWRDIFFAARAIFEEELEHIGISKTVVRLMMLQDGAVDFHERRNYIGMAALLEQAAKDVGGVFTNRREVTGKDGGKIEMSVTRDPSLFTPEEYKAMTPEQREEAKASVATLKRLSAAVGGGID